MRRGQRVSVGHLQERGSSVPAPRGRRFGLFCEAAEFQAGRNRITSTTNFTRLVRNWRYGVLVFFRRRTEKAVQSLGISSAVVDEWRRNKVSHNNFIVIIHYNYRLFSCGIVKCTDLAFGDLLERQSRRGSLISIFRVSSRLRFPSLRRKSYRAALS